MKNAKEWREFYQNDKHGGAIATIMSLQWLEEGCPMCGSKKWSVTGDCWAYCEECHKGYPTHFPFTGRHNVEWLDFSNV